MRPARAPFALLGVLGLLACEGRPPAPAPTVPPTVLPAAAALPVASPAPAATTVDAATLRAEAAAGTLPSEPERALTRAHCGICHDERYLVQQRLTPEQWTKTVEKMKTFGAPVPHSEAAQIAAYLARSFPVDLPAPPQVRVVKPE